MPRVCCRSRCFPVGYLASLALWEQRECMQSRRITALAAGLSSELDIACGSSRLDFKFIPGPQQRKPVSPNVKCSCMPSVSAQPSSGFLSWSALGFKRGSWRGGGSLAPSVRRRGCGEPSIGFTCCSWARANQGIGALCSRDVFLVWRWRFMDVPLHLTLMQMALLKRKPMCFGCVLVFKSCPVRKTGRSCICSIGNVACTCRSLPHPPSRAAA